MKFIVLRTNLKEGIAAVERTTGDNANLPILKNVLVRASGSGVQLMATNLEIAITAAVTAKVIEEGSVTVPVAAFSGIINSLQSERINIGKIGNAIEIKTDNYEAKLQGLPADDFPIVPKIQNEKEHIEIKGKTLKDALGQVGVATQYSDLRPEFNSILFHYTLEALKFAATDGFRLAEKAVSQNEFKAADDHDFRILVPIKTAQDVMRAAGDEDAVRIFHDKNQILFKTGRADVISRLVEGNFPDYSALVPEKFEAEAVVKNAELSNALKTASVFGSRTNEVKLKFHENGKAVEISAADQALGENNFILAAKITGKTKEIIFNWRYLLDALKAIKTEDVFLGLNEESNPALLKSPADGTYFYILKPIIGV